MLFVAYYVDDIDMIARCNLGGGGHDMGMHLASNANDNVDDGMHDDVGVHDDFDDIDDIMMVDDADDDDDDDDDGDVNDMEVMMSRQMSMICRGCLMWYFTQLPLRIFVDDVDVVVDAVVDVSLITLCPAWLGKPKNDS